jgi:hypothetical protein
MAHEHIVRGCVLAPPSRDGVKRHDFATEEDRDALGNYTKVTRCRHCAALPEDVDRRRRQLAAARA